jgi:hypothetical protein
MRTGAICMTRHLGNNKRLKIMVHRKVKAIVTKMTTGIFVLNLKCSLPRPPSLLITCQPKSLKTFLHQGGMAPAGHLISSTCALSSLPRAYTYIHVTHRDGNLFGPCGPRTRVGSRGTRDEENPLPCFFCSVSIGMHFTSCA